MAAIALCGCQSLEEAQPFPDLDRNAFRCEVEPVMVARCSMYACHGSGQRPLRIFGINRLRLNPVRNQESGYVLSQPMTDEEHQANLEMVLGFVDPGDHPASLLLLKPLDVEAGGYYHQGGTLYGNRDVFRSSDDAGFVAIANWLAGGTRRQDCVPVEDVGS